MIKTIKLKGFRSFYEEEISLLPLSVIVGRNGSGKSTLVDSLLFIKDMASSGVSVALARRGGFDAVKSMKLEEEGFTIDINCDCFSYEVLVKRNCIEEEVNYVDKFFKSCDGAVYKCLDGNMVYWGGDPSLEKDSIVWHSRGEGGIDELGLLELSVFPEYIGHFDIQPFLIKREQKIEGDYINEDGTNLPYILFNMFLNEKEKAKDFLYIVRDFLPWVKKIEVQYISSLSMHTLIVEDKYAGGKIPLSGISEGTLGIFATILALYFTPYKILIFEELGKYIHPLLVGRLIEHMKEMVDDKQIIITTHSPHVLDHVPLENVLLVVRNNNGHSHVYKPSEMEAIVQFLSHDISLSELMEEGIIP